MSEPYHDDGQASFYHGDVRAVLREMPPESVNVCVTSPPYWSLRDYGVEPTVWGGDPEHEHQWTGIMRQDERYTGKKKWQHLANGRGEFQDGVAAELGRDGEGKRLTVRDLDPNAWGHPKIEDTAVCECGAWRGALGLEPTPELYVEHIVEVFREVRRVLRKDGTLWLNLGDSYNNVDKWGGGGANTGKHTKSPDGSVPSWAAVRRKWAALPNLKPKDLVGIPWAVAFALRADGWWLRQDIIWAKPNPMPESVTDRCTKAHEYLFLLSKSERYYYDADAIREEPSDPGRETGRDGRPEYGDPRRLPPGANPQTLARQDFRDRGRNKRDVWTIPTTPFPEAHFATYPPALVEPCILAGSPEGGVILDPFLGSGTTAMVAKRLGRRAIGIDMSAEYLEMARRRCAQMGLMEVTA